MYISYITHLISRVHYDFNGMEELSMPAGCAISKDANDQSLKYCFSLHRGNELFMKSTHDLIPNITDWKTQTQVLLSIEAKCGFYPDCAKSMPVRETDYAWQIFYGTMVCYRYIYFIGPGTKRNKS